MMRLPGAIQARGMMMYQTNYGIAAANQAALGNQAQAAAHNAYNMPAAAPRTVASAFSRMEAANQRLAISYERLAKICAEIGGIRDVSQAGVKGTQEPSGAVDRLNDSADRSHDILDGIETILVAIERALG
jgi:hypothetical protein